MHKVNIAEKFSKISEYYKPHIAGELNGQMVKLVKANTEFVWHHHDHEDEMFLVVKGRFRMELPGYDRLPRTPRVDRDRRIHHRPARSRTSSRRRRRSLDHALRTRIHAEHRQRSQRAHPTPLGARLTRAFIIDPWT